MREPYGRDNTEQVNRAVGDLILDRPQQVNALLEAHGYKVTSPVTLRKINKGVSKLLYINRDKSFASAMDRLLASDYSNLAPLIVAAIIGAVVTAGSTTAMVISSNKQAQKAKAAGLMELQQNMRLAQMQIDAEDDIATREILANSIVEYQSQLVCSWK